MKIHRHIGVIQAETRLSLEEALVVAAAAGQVIHWIDERTVVLEREIARRVAEALRARQLHPRVYGGKQG